MDTSPQAGFDSLSVIPLRWPAADSVGKGRHRSRSRRVRHTNLPHRSRTRTTAVDDGHPWSVPTSQQLPVDIDYRYVYRLSLLSIIDMGEK